ncbi:MAG: hypothetical protein ACYS5V_07080, partial [Planctomycetota bacterium]
MADPLDDLVVLIRTRHAIVTIRTADEEHAERMIRQAAMAEHMAVMTWSLSSALRRTGPDTGGPIGGTDTLDGALRFVRGNDTPIVYVLKDALHHARNPTALRLMRDIAADFTRDRRTIFMIDAAGQIPD